MLIHTVQLTVERSYVSHTTQYLTILKLVSKEITVYVEDNKINLVMGMPVVPVCALLP